MAVDLYLVIHGGGPAIQAPPVTNPYFGTAFRSHSILELSEFSLGAAKQSPIGQSGGAVAGKATLSLLTVKRRIDSASPQLFNVLAASEHFPTVQLYGFKAGAQTSGKPYLGYEFQTVFVSDITWTSDPGDALPIETVAFAFAAMYIGVVPQDPAAKPVKHGWSTMTNSTPQEADHLFPG